MARGLDVDARLVDLWLNNTAEIPPAVSSWVEALCFAHEASELMRPHIDTARPGSVRRSEPRVEHIPVYSYNLLRALHISPVALRSLLGTDDEAAVFFLVSRGLAERVDNELVITPTGKVLGEIAAKG